MTEQDKKLLKQDADGLATYEYLANNIETCFDDLDAIIENMTNVDRRGQSVAATNDKDREHAYLPALIRGIYGDNFAEGAEERCATDRNFRRMYQRLFPRPDSL